MRITAIRETAIPINSTLRNAVFDFSEMTTSVVAMITDVTRGGKPVAGFAFNSTGRLRAARKCATAPLDYALLADVASIYDSPIGTGENLFSTQDVENLVRFGGLRADRDIIQIDVPQSYGIVQFSRTLDMLKRHGWERHSIFPHGGNQMTLAIVGGFGLGGCEAYPGVFGIFVGFADDAKVENG